MTCIRLTTLKYALCWLPDYHVKLRLRLSHHRLDRAESCEVGRRAVSLDSQPCNGMADAETLLTNGRTRQTSWGPVRGGK